MNRTGEVVDKHDDMISVVFERPEACNHCSGCSLQDRCTKVDIRGSADIGDLVDVEMPDKSIVRASFLAYIVPLALLIAGMVIGEDLKAWLNIGIDKNMFAALCGFALMAIGFAVIHAIDKKLRKRQDWQPRVVAVHKKQP